ncbi:MAG: hypothetical protein JWP30_539, partial [Homoserinimonas sp.]|nr:hypothetical protein [Homoserinimonas sp.]
MHKRAPSPERRWGVTDAAAALLLTVLLLALAPNLRLPEPWSTLVGLLIIWVPLLGAVLLATFVRGSSSLARDFGFRITGLDILVGLFLGLALRTVVSIIEVIAYGRLPMEAATFGPV